MHLDDARSTYQERFLRWGQREDVERLVAADELRVAAYPAGSLARPQCLTDLGVSYQLLYGQTTSLADLTRAIDTGKQAVEATPDGDPNLAVRLCLLTRAHRLHYERDGDRFALEIAVALSEQGIVIASEAHPEWSTCLSELATEYRLRFQHP